MATKEILLKKQNGSSNRTVRTLLTKEEIVACSNTSEAIRLCKARHPDASNGEIAKFLSRYQEKDMRPQQVFNTLNYIRKTK